MKMQRRAAVFVGILFFFALFLNKSYSFDNDPLGDVRSGYNYPNTNNVNDKRTQWSFNIMYGEKGFGVAGEYHFNVWQNTDFFAGLGFSGITDAREFQQFDVYGNSYTPDKINRVYMAPLTIGIKHAMFQDDIDGSLRPTVSAGIIPTLILTNPASTNFFPALTKFQAAFAVGPFVGVGMDFVQSKNVAFNFNVSYSYLPVIGKEVKSLQDKPLNNIGGLSFAIGVNLLH
jgi:hypothetical protein